MYRHTIAIALMVVLSLHSAATATVPTQMTVQGRLTDLAGAPFAVGSKTFIFRIFNDSAGGSEVWPGGGGEVQSITSGADGLWIGLLGAVNPLTDAVFSDSVRWLEINVDGTTLPRIRLVTGPYAFRVSTIDGASGGHISSKVSIGTSVNPGDHAFAAGFGNVASGHGSIALGSSNTASGSSSSVSGGSGNQAAGDFAVIGGGVYNRAAGDFAVVTGGGGPLPADSNSAAGEASFVGGGQSNRATGSYATVGGGGLNRAIGDASAVVGGQENSADGIAAIVSGGINNSTTADYATVSGGSLNIASGQWSSVAGGNNNSANSTVAFVGGGGSNEAGYFAFVGGGYDNLATGRLSAIPGGRSNRASGSHSFAAGHRAQAQHDAAFVWSDSTDTEFSSTARDQFLIRAGGGVGIGTNAPTKQLEVLDDSAGALKLPLKLTNQGSTAGTATGLIFQVDAGGDRGKGALVYERTSTWNRGDFHFLQEPNAGATNVGMTNKVMTISNNGNVGIGTATPTNILTVQLGSATDPIADGWGIHSSRRWKDSIETIGDAMAILTELRGVRYKWKADGRADIGLIAEEVGEIVPEVVDFEENGVDARSLDYARLVPLLIEGMKEQQQTIDELKERLARLESRP